MHSCSRGDEVCVHSEVHSAIDSIFSVPENILSMIVLNSNIFMHFILEATGLLYCLYYIVAALDQ